MAQQRGGSRKSGGGSKRSSGKSGGGSSRKSTAARSTASKSTASKSTRKAAAKKGGQARGRQQKAQKAAKSTSRAATKPAKEAGVSAKTVAELREGLRKNLIRPMGLVMLTRERIEEVLGDAVDRGRMTKDDAQTVASGLLDRGRKQTNDVLKDLEQLMGQVETRAGGARRAAATRRKGARNQMQEAARGARSRAVKAADPVLAQADRARRAVGVGPSFPITGYDELTAAQIQGRLADLTPAELRKVRDYERRHANRKSVLSAISSKLG
jgi:polyhydroxyalkanoate synthesis regulator phasin